jgi:hypothetical protein
MIVRAQAGAWARAGKLFCRRLHGKDNCLRGIFSLVFAAPDAKLEPMIKGRQQRPARDQGETAADLFLNPQWCSGRATWRQRHLFEETARRVIRLPAPDADPMEHLWSEAAWNRFVPPNDQEETVLTALSQATGVYFFPSREWVLAFCRFIRLLGIRRVLEAGAGRGYLAAALAPLLAGHRIGFKAVDTGQGEFESGLPRHPVVESMDALTAVQTFHPDLVVYAWPPPGQSIGPLSASPGVCYVLVLGEPRGGCTGDPGDWQRFRYRYVDLLSRYGLGRSGRPRQAATVFFGASSPLFREKPI